MRVVAVIAVLLGLGAASAAAAPVPKAPAPVFVLTGGGWGHGVGMSQWGAYGQANAGRDYRQILATYYRGTDMGSAPDTLLKRVRVLVGDSLATVAVTNVAAVFDGAGKRYPVAGGSITAGPDLKLPVGKNGKPLALAGPVTIRAAKDAFLSYAGKEFRGDLRVANISGRVQLVNVVGLEAYLLGVVPGEMPKDWPLAALEAQAVAARTYAVANVVRGRPLRPLLRLAQPGLLRRRLGGARPLAGRPRDGRPDPHLRRSAGARRSTSPRAAVGRSVRSTPSASTCRTSSRSTTRGTRPHRTTPGRLSS